MKYLSSIIVILPVLFTFHVAEAQTPLQYVDLFIATSGDHGQLDPSATVPFGMVKLGPDTEPGNHSGYNFEAQQIRGFSHNRIGGVGCSGAGGNLRVLPGIGDSVAGSAPILKSTERAIPGYYSISFENGIDVELTASNYTGFHQYAFPRSKKAFLHFDLNSSFARFISSEFEIINEEEFYVRVSAQNVCNKGRYTVFYHVWCSEKLELEQGDGTLTAYFRTRKGKKISLQVTASSISAEDARSTWETLSSGQNFEDIKAEASQQWLELLSRIEVEGLEEYKTLFYTHLYHMLLNPVLSENPEGMFRATDGNLYESAGYEHFDSWSMWDNFRNKFSLISLIAPEYARDFAHSLVDLFRYGKADWAGYNEPVPTVRTEHSIVTLLDLYQRGITDFDLEAAYVKLAAEIDNRQGHTPDTKLEKAYDYWALSEIAGILDRKEEQELLIKEMEAYRSTWKQYFSKTDSTADIMHYGGLYEGTLWQYRWHVQFDIPGLIELFGGIENYTTDLEYFFDHNLYNHGNQPDIHVPFMFNYSSKPWLTQKWVNSILTKNMYQYYGTHNKWDTPYFGRIYKAEPEGYIPEMDDDEGTMSAWFVLSSMGLYPLEVGKPVFQLSSPIFDRVRIRVSDEKYFEITTADFSDQQFYIQSTTLNGNEYVQPWINHSELTNGGVLHFELGEKPNMNWGKDKLHENTPDNR